MLAAFVGSRGFKFAVIALIVVNAAAIGLETYPAAALRWGGLINLVDRVILAVFTLEIALRFFAAESKAAFFKDPWQWLDIVVVSCGWIPAASFMTVFRLARVLRILHSIIYLPNLQKLANALFSTLPALSNVLVVLAIIFYIYGVIGTYLFGAVSPGRFGTLDRSVLTLFEVMTLEGWATAMHDVMAAKAWAWAYFVSFILGGTFFAMNAFVAILVSNLSFLVEDTDLARVEATLKRIEERLENLREEKP